MKYISSVLQIMGVASGGARVGLTAGFDILPPKPDETEQDYLDKALGAAEARYKTFSDDVKTATLHHRANKRP